MAGSSGNRPLFSLCYTFIYLEVFPVSKNIVRKAALGGLIPQSVGKTAYALAFLVQQMEQPGWLFADEVDAARVVYVVNVMPADAFESVLLLVGGGEEFTRVKVKKNVMFQQPSHGKQSELSIITTFRYSWFFFLHIYGGEGSGQRLYSRLPTNLCILKPAYLEMDRCIIVMLNSENIYSKRKKKKKH